MRPPLLLGCLAVLLSVTACSGGGEDPPSSAAASAPVPGVTLPADELMELVPTPAEVPAGMTPLLTATGPRDLSAIAGFSADPAAAATALKANGFRKAYVAQYAHPSDGRVLSVVAVRFATAKGATADLAADLRTSAGTKVSADRVGDLSAATTQPLPQGAGELVTLRFRSGATTWLVAYGAKPKADPAIAVRLGKALVGRSTT